MRRTSKLAAGLLALSGGLATLFAPAPVQLEVAARRVGIDDSSCRMCHPGPTKALRTTPHAFLLDKQADTACSVCHGDATLHASTAIDPDKPRVDVGPVRRAACTACHPGSQWETSRGAHTWRKFELPAAEAKPGLEPAAPKLAALGFDWSAMAAAGYRFLNKSGSRDRYKTDLNLDRGFRLFEFELEGHAIEDDHFADFVRVHASDIADPYQRVGARIEKDELYRADAGYLKSAVTYRAGGDYHRVDQKSQESHYDSSFDLDREVEVFAGFRRWSQDGYWLTNRVGNRNITPVTTINGVESPRRHDADSLEAGIQGAAYDTTFTAAFEYRDERQRDRWLYSQAAQANPSFPDSEDFASQTTLRGPGMRFHVGKQVDAIGYDVNARYLDLDRRVISNGTGAGFDISDFTSTTRSASAGDAETWVVDGTVTAELADWLALISSLRWVDHSERMLIDQTDVKTYPSLSTSSTVRTLLDQHTSQRVFSGTLELEGEVFEGLTLTLGYGWIREWLTVPDLVANDNDFRSGLAQNDGGLFGAHWRPNQHWVLRARFQQFGQNGVQLHDIVEDQLRTAAGSVRYKTDRGHLEVFAKDRRSRNNDSATRIENFSTGVSGVVHNEPGTLDLHGSWVWSDIDSRTLTNFYFDPDPNPVATLVGFDGQTHTWTLGAGLEPSARVHWRLDGIYTTTSGSFDVDLLDWQSDLHVRLIEGGDLGVLLRSVDYEEQGNSDDYQAVMTMVYWRQRIGARRH